MDCMKFKGEVVSVVKKARAQVMTPAKLRLIEAVTAIRSDPENVEWAFMARQLVQCTLPHRNPGNVEAWQRKNGNVSLVIRPGWDHDEQRPIGYPYGSIPRLLLFWIVTEAKRTGNRRLELGHSLAEFMRLVGLSPDTGGGKRGDAKRLREQMRRLFGAIISFQQSLSGPDRRGVRWLDMQVAPQGELWWDVRRPEEPTLWGSWIQLGEDFFNAIITAPVPLDMRALKSLKQSPLALDIYAVLNYRAHTTKEPFFLSWELLRMQLGTEISDNRDFKKELLPMLSKVLTVAPHLKIKQVRGGLMVHPSRAAIAAHPTS
jgi:hypothetical protein